MHDHDNQAMWSYWNHPATKLTIGAQPNYPHTQDAGLHPTTILHA